MSKILQKILRRYWQRIVRFLYYYIVCCVVFFFSFSFCMPQLQLLSHSLRSFSLSLSFRLALGSLSNTLPKTHFGRFVDELLEISKLITLIKHTIIRKMSNNLHYFHVVVYRIEYRAFGQKKPITPGVFLIKSLLMQIHLEKKIDRFC